MTEHQKKKNFLHLPRYTGGNKAFRAFITENLRYPEGASQARVDGFVIVEYDITDDGLVKNPRILKGLGHGCDEEAIRVIGLLRYEKVKNRGVRVKVTTKTTIHFRPPQVNISYTVSETKKTHKHKEGSEQKNRDAETYSYTINL